ncbi:MAG TPA: AraC family transcriptional regulator [Thermoanaerobaculia bacterium]|nr:AraC family transcriptional regulator [Thermoanaerobaculia bacterium]
MDATTFTAIGAGFGASLSWTLSRRARRNGSPAENWLAVAVLCGVTAAIAILTGHRLPDHAWLFEKIEYAAALLAGPSLLFYVRSAVAGKPGEWRLHLAAPLAPLLLPSTGGTPLLGTPIEIVMLVQMTYTAAAAMALWRGRQNVQRAQKLVAPATIMVMASIHAAQIGRTLSHVAAMREIVPLTIAAGFLFAGAWALSRLPFAPAHERRQHSPTVPAEDGVVMERLRQAMTAGHLYRRSDLSLANLAAEIGTTQHELSRILNQSIGTSYHDLLAEYRVADAERRLQDRANDRYTIDALAEASGFRSRSAFYLTFRRVTGMTPTEYRARSRSEPHAPLSGTR